MQTSIYARHSAATPREALAARRRYTAQDWERDNAGRVYESTAEMDAALDEYCALPDAESGSWRHFSGW